MADYPELERLEKYQGIIEVLDDFFEYLRSQGLVTGFDNRKAFLQFLGFDGDVVKREILDQMQEALQASTQASDN